MAWVHPARNLSSDPLQRSPRTFLKPLSDECNMSRYQNRVLFSCKISKFHRPNKKERQPHLTRTQKHTPLTFTACPYQSRFYPSARAWIRRCCVYRAAPHPLLSFTGTCLLNLCHKSPPPPAPPSPPPPQSSLSSRRHMQKKKTCDFSNWWFDPGVIVVSGPWWVCVHLYVCYWWGGGGGALTCCSCDQRSICQLCLH